MQKGKINELYVYKEKSCIYPFKQEADLLEAIISRNLSSAYFSGECFLSELIKNNGQELNYIKTCVLHLTVFLIRKSIQIGVDVGDLFNANLGYAKILMQADSIKEIREVLRGYILILFNNRSKKRKSCKYEIVMKAKAYVNSNLQNPITLDEVAGYVFLSPCYFSRLFSEVSGYTFQDYLTKVRINKAQKLLLENNRSLEEVAYMLGYNDVSYFIKVFKKVVGNTPRQFAQSFQLN
ncbi:MAG: AraC family transcriptional regulator [Bacillota bacterium]|nr:AraC family transcriptional regulator [Bacillota bacterium]